MEGPIPASCGGPSDDPTAAPMAATAKNAATTEFTSLLAGSRSRPRSPSYNPGGRIPHHCDSGPLGETRADDRHRIAHHSLPSGRMGCQLCGNQTRTCRAIPGKCEFDPTWPQRKSDRPKYNEFVIRLYRSQWILGATRTAQLRGFAVRSTASRAAASPGR
jgi:hypothetical protein